MILRLNKQRVCVILDMLSTLPSSQFFNVVLSDLGQIIQLIKKITYFQKQMTAYPLVLRKYSYITIDV